MLFAAQSVGTSHLVQSTRAGGEYGFSLTLLIVIACIAKYPAFRFGIDYVNATGKSLLEYYLAQGKLVLTIFLVSLIVDMFVATAAVTLVSAGLLSAVMGFELNSQYFAIFLLAVFASLLILGGYRIFESITKIFVLVFFSLSIIASILSWFKLSTITTDLFPSVFIEETTLLFMIAVAGWMPTSVSASVYLSEWRAKKLAISQKNDKRSSSFDFDLGYWGTAILALFFLSMGALLIYPSGLSTEQSAIGFASLLFTMFTSSLGQWAYPVIAIAALAVMFSTSLSLMDACPRAGQRILERFSSVKYGYQKMIVIQLIGASGVLLFLMSSFISLIDLATSLAFTTAPFIAFLNHRAMFRSDIKRANQPSKILRIWSLVGFALLSLFAALFIFIRFMK